MPDRNQLIIDYMPLVKATVARFLKRSFGSHLCDDMVSAGYAKLVYVADLFADKDPFNVKHFSRYVRQAVSTACIDTIRENSLLQAPHNDDARQSPQLGDCYNFEDYIDGICLNGVQLSRSQQNLFAADADLWPHAFEADERTLVLNFIHGDTASRCRLRPELNKILKRLVE